MALSNSDIKRLNDLSPDAERVGLGDRVFEMGNVGIQAGLKIFVSGDTGQDTNTGTSWEEAYATMQKACDQATALHAARDDIYSPIEINILPSATAYAPITAMPNYTNFIGHGAPPFGNGTGIVTIDSTSSVDAVTGGFRGCRFYNIQFGAFDGQNCFYASNLILRSGWYGCAFAGMVNEATAPLTAILCDGPFAGNEIIHCSTIMNESPFVTGFSFAVANGGAINGNRIDDCVIIATTVGLITGSTGWDYGSIIKNCFVGGPGGITCDKGIFINSEEGQWVVSDNTVVATDAIEYTNHADKSVFNNKVINGTTPVTEPTLHGSA